MLRAFRLSPSLLTRRVAARPLFLQPQNRNISHSHKMTATHPSLTPISTQDAPAAVGPYSQAIRVADTLYCSGSLGLIPETGKLIEGGVEAQARQALKNMRAVVEAGGSELGKVIKTTVFLKDMNDFKTANGVYTEFFGEHRPARSAVEVACLPLDALFEIECIARV